VRGREVKKKEYERNLLFAVMNHNKNYHNKQKYNKKLGDSIKKSYRDII